MTDKNKITDAAQAQGNSDRQSKRLSSGVAALDARLNGGMRTGCLTEFHSEEGNGLSAFAHRFAVTAQLPVKYGGLEGDCVYIDTRDTFWADRIQAITDRLPVDTRKALHDSHNIPRDSESTEELGKKILDHIHVLTPNSTSEQLFVGNQATKLVEKKNIRTIVVDSLTHWFREEYSNPGEFAEGQHKLNESLNDLLGLASLHNCCLIATHKMSRPHFGGGKLLAHRSTDRIRLRKTGVTEYRAYVIDSPGQSDSSVDGVEFQIKDGCIVST